MPRGGKIGNKGNAKGQSDKGFKHAKGTDFPSGLGTKEIVFVQCVLCGSQTRTLQRFREELSKPLSNRFGRRQRIGGYRGLSHADPVEWNALDNEARDFVQVLVPAIERRLRDLQSKSYWNSGLLAENHHEPRQVQARQDSSAKPAARSSAGNGNDNTSDKETRVTEPPRGEGRP